MENKKSLIYNESEGHFGYIKVEKFNTPVALIKAIKKRNPDLTVEYIKRVLAYNVIPIKSLSKITGISTSTIHVKFRPYDSKRLGKQVFPLLKCIPFPDLHEFFVLRDERCQKLIEKRNGYNTDAKGSKKATA